MDMLPFLPEIDDQELDQLQPIEFGYPEAQKASFGLPGEQLDDALRTSIGNRQGPVPQAQLDAMTPSQLRALKNERFEAASGWAKPLAQFFNTVTSPAVGEGMLIGIPNALLKLGNSFMDETFGDDGIPAWQISQEPLKQINPLREGDTADTPADPFGYELGAESVGEVAGALTGSTLLRRVPQVGMLANRLKQTQAVRRLAVTAKTNQTARRALNTVRWGGEAMIDTSLAALYQDADLGNVMDLAQAGLGWAGSDTQLPLTTQEGNSYAENLRNKVIADGILLPLTLIGAGQLTPWTRRLADGDLAWDLDEIADVELAPYMPRGITQPLLAPATDQFDSAIDRSTSTNLQIQQVQQQRDRVNTMFPGLKTFEGGEGQFQLDITGAGGAYREDGTPLPRVDNPDGEGTVVGGPEMEFRQRPKQGQLELGSFGDAPDPRPEISTYLAELDELSDDQLKELLPKVSTKEQLAAREEVLQQAQARVDAAEAQIQSIKDRLALPEGKKGKLTEQGSKRLLNKANAELETARLQLSNITAEPLKAENVGDQLALTMQQSLDLTPESGIELPPIRDMEWDEATEMWRPSRTEGGYPSLEAYREDISGWNRDILRGMASPSNSPEVAALLKARTGRRVWNAKKSDIVDALVELASRRNRYAVMPEQLPIEGLQQNLNLDVAPEYRPRGLTAEAREEMKRKVLEAALENGEVQPDVTPIPDTLPATEFNQGQLLDTLFDVDGDGQMMIRYANDELPTYKAGGRSADALIEEVRQRFGWAELDGAAKRASDQALFEKNGWNLMTWDQKKKMFAESRGLYADTPREVTEIDLPGTEVSTQKLEWTPDGNISAEEAAAVKPKPQPKKRKRKTGISTQVKKARETTSKAEAEVAALKKQLERATCNG